MFGGFTERKQTYKYMMLDEKWNPSMIVIYGYGLLVSSFVYLLMRFLMYDFFYIIAKNQSLELKSPKTTRLSSSIWFLEPLSTELDGDLEA